MLERNGERVGGIRGAKDAVDGEDLARHFLTAQLLGLAIQGLAVRRGDRISLKVFITSGAARRRAPTAPFMLLISASQSSIRLLLLGAPSPPMVQ